MTTTLISLAMPEDSEESKYETKGLISYMQDFENEHNIVFPGKEFFPILASLGLPYLAFKRCIIEPTLNFRDWSTDLLYID